MARYAFAISAIIALFLTAVSGFVFIPWLKKLEVGQTINEIGPVWHKGKQGIPTIGGLMFILGSCIGLLAGLPFLKGVETDMDPKAVPLLVVGLIATIAFSLVGFFDDYLKVVRKNNLGLNATGKLIMQALIAICFLATLQLMGRLSTIVQLPFFGVVEFGIFFYPLAFLLIVGMVNAVNLTDGIDGLASMVTVCVMCGYFVLLMLAGKYYLSIWATALAGSLVGFLFWNFHPAKIFMGDTGSMFLGGAVVCIGFCMGRPDFLLILGFIYLLEAFSVMLQRFYFKVTKGKRIFKMTPIHHHFEMSGWSEVKINVVFSFVTVMCAFIAYLYMRLTS